MPAGPAPMMATDLMGAIVATIDKIIKSGRRTCLVGESFYLYPAGF